MNDIRYQFRHGNMVVKLIFANVGVFLALAVFRLFSFFLQSYVGYYLVLRYLEVPAAWPQLLHQPWSVFTYMFLHEGFLHLLFNMLWLYWFGEIFVLFLGDKKVLPVYLTGGLIGACFYLLAFNFIPAFQPLVAGSFMLGASAGIFAVVFAAATLSPDYEIRLLFLGIVRLKYVALVPLLLDIISIPNGNAGGYIAHLGGALSGYLYIKALQRGTDVGSPFNGLLDRVAQLFRKKSGVRVTYKSSDAKSAPHRTRNENEQEKIDKILDKISRSGYESLTKAEKDFLFHYSNKD